MDGPIRRNPRNRFRGEPAHLGETDLAIADQDIETADPEQRLGLT
jgi:hypothetical protein